MSLAGIAAAAHYARLGLTLAHYDARAHLVVARRIFDSLTPGWQQIGAVWLPLPHLLNMVPVQIDALYRNGFSGVAISIASMAVAAWAVAVLVQRATGSALGGFVAAALLMLNPDVLYLQSTPMTEPLLFGTTFLSVALVARWLDRLEQQPDHSAAAPGWALTAACLTRYEAWPITGAALVLAWLVLMRRGWRPLRAARTVARLASWPAWTIALFLVNSRITVGAWFVSSGFFVPNNAEGLGHPLGAWHQVWQGLFLLTGPALPRIGWIAMALLVVAYVRSRARASIVLVLALAACAALPWAAYYKGHPVRLRYDVPLVAAAAAIVGVGIGVLPRRLRAAVGVLVVALAVWQARPFDRHAPVITESQLDARNTIGRRAVTAYLVLHRDGEPILMSMGSLAHYMHDLSYDDFAIRDFVHEGNGELWKQAMAAPRPFVGWIVVEEHAEGGDALYWRGKNDPSFFAGFDRVAEGGGVALYQRRAVKLPAASSQLPASSFQLPASSFERNPFLLY
ncbi:MAG TPA: hypothetical protein VFX12_12900 [Vicinamibacterales bacterium]|nr:hypothetical protein [Vicinamibacterales bacterium]